MEFSSEYWAGRDDVTHEQGETYPGWVESNGYWLGGAEKLTLKPVAGGWYLSSREQCRYFGCSRICLERHGSLSEMFREAESITASNSDVMIVQVRRNIARLQKHLGEDR